MNPDIPGHELMWAYLDIDQDDVLGRCQCWPTNLEFRTLRDLQRAHNEHIQDVAYRMFEEQREDEERMGRLYTHLTGMPMPHVAPSNPGPVMKRRPAWMKKRLMEQQED